VSQSPYAPPSADLGSGLPTEMIGARGDLAIGTAFSEAWAATWRNFPLWLGTAIVYVLAFAASVVTGVGILFALPVLGWGLVRFGLNMYDGGARLADLFSGFSRYGRALTAMLGYMAGITVVSLAGQSVQILGQFIENDPVYFVGTVLYAIVSLLVLPRLTFAALLIVDQDMGGFDALRRSWEATRPCKWQVIGLYVVSVLVVIAGMLVLIVGMIPAMVVSGMMWVSGYRQLFGRPAAG